VASLAESIDAHRKRRQALHPHLTLTAIYNVLEKLRLGSPLSPKERRVHDDGLVSVLRQLHDDLDLAVAEIYGLHAAATEAEIVTYLLALNEERSAEEQRGLVRWLRPSLQAPMNVASQMVFSPVDVQPSAPKAIRADRIDWPKALAEQAQAVRSALSTVAAPVDAALVALQFKGARVDRIDDLLATLASLGQARAMPDGKYSAV
jgi:hypothetical protein